MDTRIYIDALSKGDAPDAIVPFIVTEARRELLAEQARSTQRERFDGIIPLSNTNGVMTVAGFNLPRMMTTTEWEQLLLTLRLWRSVMEEGGDEAGEVGK